MIDGIFNRGTATSLLTQAGALGVTIPAKARTAIQTAIATCERTRAWAPDTKPLAQCVIEAHAAKRDPLTDPAVIAAATAQQIGTVRDAVNRAANAGIDDAVREHADAIATAIAEAYRDAADTLAAALDILDAAGVAYDAEAMDLARQPVNVFTAYQSARQAGDRTDRLHRMSLPLYRFQSQAARAAHVVDSADLDTDALAKLAGLNAVELIGQGFTVDLATPTQLRSRLARAARNADQNMFAASLD